jgi:hypothetical protein
MRHSHADDDEIRTGVVACPTHGRWPLRVGLGTLVCPVSECAAIAAAENFRECVRVWNSRYATGGVWEHKHVCECGQVTDRGSTGGGKPAPTTPGVGMDFTAEELWPARAKAPPTPDAAPPPWTRYHGRVAPCATHAVPPAYRQHTTGIVEFTCPVSPCQYVSAPTLDAAVALWDTQAAPPAPRPAPRMETAPESKLRTICPITESRLGWARDLTPAAGVLHADDQSEPP